jgi:hypothetical protein
MLIKATRPFSSVKIGNVSAGDVIEADAKYSKHLIEHGLAVELTAGPCLSLGAESSFQPPVEADQSGSLSQVGQASPAKIASASNNGAKITYRKRAKSRL